MIADEIMMALQLALRAAPVAGLVILAARKLDALVARVGDDRLGHRVVGVNVNGGGDAQNLLR